MGQKLEAQKRLYLDKTSTALTRALGRPAAHNEISTARPDDVAVVQALELLNGEEFYERIYSGRLADQITNEKKLAQIVNRLYWIVLSRPASDQEQKLGENFLQTSTGPGAPPSLAAISVPNRQPFGDVLWALFTCPEFQYIK